MLDSLKTSSIGALGYIVTDTFFTRDTISFLIQTCIGVLTIVYLIIKSYNLYKNERDN